MFGDLGVGAEQKNWSDYGAFVTNGKGGRFPVIGFFRRGQGPHKIKQLSGEGMHFLSHVKRAVSKLASAQKGQSDLLVEVDKAAVDTASKEKRQQLAVKAREALAKRKDEANKRRKVNLGAAALAAS